KKLKPRCDAPPATAAPIAAAVVTPQILTLAAIASQRRGDGAGGDVGIGRLGDRPADDEDRGAGIERRLRRDDPLLIGGVAAGETDAGDDEEAVRPGGAAGGDLVARADHPV